MFTVITLTSTFFKKESVFPVGWATVDPLFLKSWVGGTFQISIHSFMWNLTTLRKCGGGTQLKKKHNVTHYTFKLILVTIVLCY